MGTKFAPVLATRGARFEPDSAELVGAQTRRLRRPRSGWHKSTKPGRSRRCRAGGGPQRPTGASVNAVRESRGHGSASRPLVTGAPGRLPPFDQVGLAELHQRLAMGAACAAPIEAGVLRSFYEHSSGAGAEMMWVSDPGGRMKK